jgi:hypothetical protein
MYMKSLIATGLVLAMSQACMADGTPWLSEPGSTQFSFTQVQQDSDEFYRNTDNTSLKAATGLDELVLQTTWLGLNYSIDDDLALDVKTGYAKNKNENGLADTTVGVSWRLVDEFISYNNVPSTVVRAAVILQGDYATGSPSAIGDGADGLELSVIMGQFISPKIAVSGELGYRGRNSDVPDDAFFKVGAYALPLPGISLSINYSRIDALDGVNIGEEGFIGEDGAPNFHKLEEDSELVDLGFSYSPTPQLNLGFNAGKVIDGKNTAKSDVFALTLGYSL